MTLINELFVRADAYSLKEEKSHEDEPDIAWLLSLELGSSIMRILEFAWKIFYHKRGEKIRAKIAKERMPEVINEITPAKFERLFRRNRKVCGYGCDCLIHIAVGKSCNQVILDCLTRVNRRFFELGTGISPLPSYFLRFTRVKRLYFSVFKHQILLKYAASFSRFRSRWRDGKTLGKIFPQGLRASPLVRLRLLTTSIRENN